MKFLKLTFVLLFVATLSMAAVNPNYTELDSDEIVPTYSMCNAAVSSSDSVTFDGVLYTGGVQGGSPANNSYYTTDGTHFYEITTTSNYTARYNHAQASVPIINTTKGTYREWTFVFGGIVGGVPSSSTYKTTDGVVWTAVTPSPDWGARYNHCVIYNDVVGKFVLSGGIGADGLPKNDVWTSSTGEVWVKKQ